MGAGREFCRIRRRFRGEARRSGQGRSAASGRFAAVRPVDEKLRREENDDLAHHETLAHAIKDRLDGLETQYGDRRGDKSHGRVLQFALEFLGDCYSACKFAPHMRGIGIQNSYDLFQAQSACAIHPVSYEARMNMFGEAEVRTPA